jgi:hypothetical protein
LISDRGDDELARELFTSRWADSITGFRGAGGRIAVARPVWPKERASRTGVR